MYSFRTSLGTEDIKTDLSELLVTYNRQKKLLPELIVKSGSPPEELYVYVKPRLFSYSYRSLPETKIRQLPGIYLIQTRINPIMLVVYGTCILFLLFALVFYYNTPTLLVCGIVILIFIIPTWLTAKKQHQKIVMLVKEIASKKQVTG